MQDFIGPHYLPQARGTLGILDLDELIETLFSEWEELFEINFLLCLVEQRFSFLFDLSR